MLSRSTSRNRHFKPNRPSIAGLRQACVEALEQRRLLAADFSLISLGEFPSGTRAFQIEGVSGNGSAVVGDYTVDDIRRPFRWTEADGIETVPLPSEDQAGYGGALNYFGDVVVGTDQAGGGSPQGERWSQAFRWQSMVGVADLGFIHRGYSSFATGADMHAFTVVGYAGTVNGFRAFQWKRDDFGGPGEMISLEDLYGGEDFSLANAVSGDGRIVAGRSSSTASGFSGREAFRWDAESGMVGLGDLPGGAFQSLAFDISFDGGTIVGYSHSNVGGSVEGPINEAFRWTQNQGMVGLGLAPGGISSQAYGVSGSGSVIVGSTARGSGSQALRWTTETGFQHIYDLLVAGGVNPADDGWETLNVATDVSADGQVIVGDGVRNGKKEPFLAVIPFEQTNTAPVASDDTASTAPATPVVINVLANDIDADGGSLAIAETTNPANGTISVSGRTITYSPNDGFTGTDSFTYRAFDGVATSNLATVTVTVTEEDDGGGGGGGGGEPIATLDAATGFLTINGTDAADVISLNRVGNVYRVSVNDRTADFDVAKVGLAEIFAGAGDDVITLGDDAIASRIFAGAGNDTLRGGLGNDELYGEDGEDMLDGHGGNDLINGGDGDDYLMGGTGVDYDPAVLAAGYFDRDTLLGGAGNDTLSGGLDENILDGGAGNDLLNGSGSRDTLFGGDGNDTLRGGGNDDRLTGGDGDDVLRGFAGDDRFAGGAGLDRLFGGDGTDTDEEADPLDVLDSIENIV